MARIVIVGGGISGLAVAYRLQQRLPAAEVTVLEGQSRPGGTIGSLRRDGFLVETGPNGFLDTNPATLELARQIGLGDDLVAASPVAARNRYLLLGGRLRRLPTGPFSFLTSGVLSWRGKLALLTERFRRRGGAGDESVDAFARRRAGSEVAETLAEPFVTGIFAGDSALLSMRAAFPRLAALERDYGSVSAGMAAAARQRRAEAAARGEAPRRPGRMWSFRDGLQRLTDTLAAALPRPPVLGAAARRVFRTPTGWAVAAEGRDRWDADAVVLACPAHEQAGLLADLDPGLAEEVAAIPYNRVAVVALGYPSADVGTSLDGFGYLVPRKERGDVLGVQWCSSIYPGRAPDGCVLLRAMCGGWHRPEVVDWDDERLLGAVRAELARTLNVHAAPVFHQVVHWPRAIPQYHVGHLERLARIDARLTAHAGLYLGGNAYRGVALNDCTEQADVLAGRVAAGLAVP